MLNKLAALIQKLSPGLRQVIGNTSWLLADKIFQMGLGLVVGIWVARYLQPTDYGLLTFAITFVALFSAIANLGLGTIVIRDLARDPLGKDETLGTAFALQLIGGVLTLFLTVGTIALLKPDDTLTRWLVGIVAAGTIFQAFSTIEYWFQSQLQSKYTVIANNVVSVCYAGLRISLIQIGVSVLAFAGARLAEVALKALALVVAYRSNGNHIRSWRCSLSRAKALLQESWMLVLSGLAIYIYASSDQVMLGSLLDDTTELGFYSAAVKVSEVFNFIPAIVYQSLLPKFTELKKKDPNIYLQKFQIYFDVMSMLWILVAVPVCLLSPYLITILYGKSYAMSSAILSIYVWAQFGSNFGMARSAYLAVENKLHFSLYLSIIGAVTNVILNLFLIPNYGAIGATIATLITYFLVIVCLNFFFQDLRIIGRMILKSLNFYKAVTRIIKLVQ
ncbi:MAG: flippase [Coleofasciculus sp. A1-SPW-01]|uniref:flippase n=1 Tax=Coleofasciculus sp. A1-SPW-01 TaxID=3070819 RepID=UPI0032FAB022